METYLKTLDIPIDEFYREVRDAQNETEDPYISTFIDCLVASTDYDSFYRVMAREGQRSQTMKYLLKSQKNPESEAKLEADAKSDSKRERSTPMKGEKGGDDEESDRRGNDDYDADEKKSYK